MVEVPQRDSVGMDSRGILNERPAVMAAGQFGWHRRDIRLCPVLYLIRGRGVF